MKRVAVIIFCVIAVLANSAVSQEKQQEPAQHKAPHATARPMIMRGDLNAHFIGAEMSFGGKLVKGAPYSAEAVTESIQMLADGNRIVRRSTAMIYRDSEGRTRHERTMNLVGPYAVAGEPPQMVFINDPVAGVNYILDARNRTARKLNMPRAVAAGDAEDVTVWVSRAPEPAAAEKAAIEATVSATVGENHARIRRAPPMPPGVSGAAGFRMGGGEADPDNTVTESLGKQIIEGVEAEGTRTTVTIPAGKIGNELPIQIVSESWYSPELQVTVMSRHSDPRFGENTYRLTGINRNEPVKSLFEVPSDYTIKESNLPEVRLRQQRELKRKASNQ
ncbi:MAG TPA: hypothetical protein VNO14_02575 [Blastocatellia bacterium]|nr:hypothetical protein [Blastocatellia bacterium]